jgi:hypothetical protein
MGERSPSASQSRDDLARYAADGGFTLPIAARLISAQATAG